MNKAAQYVATRSLKREMARSFVEDTCSTVATDDAAGTGERPAQRPGPGPASSGTSPCTPVGITGYNQSTCPIERGVGIDWLRLVVPEQHRLELLERLRRKHGPELYARGQWMYQQACRWESGARLMWEHRSGTCCVDLSGGALAAYTLQDLRDLARFGYDAGGRCTRLDVAIDYRPGEAADDVGLVNRVVAACEAGHLCVARVWEPFRKTDRTRGLVNNGVALGVRGSTDGSGRYVRVYDKGLQTNTDALGQWERWEAEFSGEVADQVARRLLVDGSDDDGVTLADARRLALGAVEFRPGTGQRSRRKLSDWYASITQGRPAEWLRKTRHSASIDRTADWIRKQVAPRLMALAERTGRKLTQVVDDLAQGARASTAAAVDLLAAQYADRHAPHLAGGITHRDRFDAWMNDQAAASPRREWDACDFWEHNRRTLAAAVAATIAVPRWAGVVGFDPVAVDDLPF